MQKQLSDSNSSSPTKASKYVPDSPKLTKWLLTDSNNENKPTEDKIIKKKRAPKPKKTSPSKISSWLTRIDKTDKFPPLNIETLHGNKDNNNVTSESDDFPLKLKTKFKIKTKPRDSFGKYGICLPSFSDIIQERDNFKTYSIKIDRICDIRNATDLKNVVHKIESPKKLPILGCEQLSLNEIDRYFRKYKNYCIGIMEGRIASKRHDKYQTQTHGELNMNGLTYNTSMVTFSHEQKQRLAKLCNRNFADMNGIENLTQYYFQVLLPELCLKIFMDVHYLSKNEAVEYLDKRPVEDLK